MFKMYPERYPTIEELKVFLTDIKSTAHHEVIISNVVEIIKDISEIESILVTGSLGKGEGDIFSDIDLVVVHEEKPEHSEVLRDAILNKIEKSTDVLYYYTSGFTNRIIFIKPLVKLELIVRTGEEAKVNWRYADAKILFDRSGLGESIKEETNKMSFKIEDILSWVGNSATFLPTMFYLATASVVRGEYITAMDGFDWIRSQMLKVSGWLLGQRDEGPRRAEQRFPSEVLTFYRDSRVGEAMEIFNALIILMDWYENWMVPRFEENKIPHSKYQLEVLREIIPYLKTKL